ncbi:hypothetical protein BJ878DRAFT_559272 [Calycina marina]|uniref:Integral membrane protein n=1 Tax=Calycina marina TaxID=1763456 RepID=A0A9P7YWC8_9HELO|nr:hypothetical protein BJ878DRAFT_559272 [Calycina marina]
MAQSTSQPLAEKPLPATPAENPLKAIGNRVKSALQSQNNPSIRVLRNSTSTDEYDRETVELLDVIDPEVATLSTITNVQNSLFLPSVGKLFNRKPAYKLEGRPSESRSINRLKNHLKQKLSSKSDSATEENPLPGAQYAILPDGETLYGWTPEDKAELDDLVRHSLHSKRAQFKRAMKGFRQYVRRPMGLFITVYATLITLFGAAWVLFLIGWISVGSKKDYVVNVVDNVLVALFAIIGDGLAPFRAVDTYHMAYIAHYHRKTWKCRDKLGLPELADHNDLPERNKEEPRPADVDLESLLAKRSRSRSIAKRLSPMIPKRMGEKWVNHNKLEHPDPVYEYTVLTPEEQATLEFHERKFSKSHTFYKPHETATHYAFPLKLLVVVVTLLDLHSCLQIALGACTWGINYKTRPFALTTVILCFSITCNITAGVLISKGDKRTRKTEVIERMMRQELTQEAMDKVNERRIRIAEERGELDPMEKAHIENEKARKEEEENQEIKKSWKSVPSLPKKLLGKGEDHRQPALPQEARSSNPSMASSIEKGKKGKSKNVVGLSSLKEDPIQPIRPVEPAATSDDPRISNRQKIMSMLRKADLDKS